MYTLTASGLFSAAHSISTFPKGHKCKNLHGHTWEVELAYEFLNNDKDGICFDFGKLKEVLLYCTAQLDHKNLDELFPNKFGDVYNIPSAENIAKWIYNEVESFCEEESGFGFLVGRKRVIKVKESANSWVTYNGES